MSARDRILNRVDEATRETKDAIAKARAEARAQGKPFDLKKFHADRAEAESKKRNLRHPVSKKVKKDGTPYTDKEIADVRVSQARGRRGKREQSVVNKTIDQRGKKRHGNTVYDEVSDTRFIKYTPEEAEEEKKRIRKKREARQAKGPSKPMNLPDHNESDYTDDEVIKLIMTESYLSLFGFLSEKKKVDEGIITNFLQGFKNKRSSTFVQPEVKRAEVLKKQQNNPDLQSRLRSVDNYGAKAGNYANRSSNNPHDPFNSYNVTDEPRQRYEADMYNPKPYFDPEKFEYKPESYTGGPEFTDKTGEKDRQQARDAYNSSRETAQNLRTSLGAEVTHAENRRQSRLDRQKKLKSKVSGPLGGLRRGIANVFAQRGRGGLYTGDYDRKNNS